MWTRKVRRGASPGKQTRAVRDVGASLAEARIHESPFGVLMVHGQDREADVGTLFSTSS